MRTFLYILLFVLAFQLSYAQIIPLSEPEMIETSDDIVRGTVLSTKSDWTDDRSLIFTTTRLVVEEVFAGTYNIGDTVAIVAPGGYDPETKIGLVVSHQAVFEPGEESVVFLKKAEGYIDAVDYEKLKNDSHFPSRIERVNSYHLGKRSVVRSDETSTKLIVDPNARRTRNYEQHNNELREEIKRLEDNLQF